MGARFIEAVRGAGSALLMVALLLSLGGCGMSVSVEGTLPEPVVTPLPLKMGIYFPEEFKTFVHEEKVREGGKYRIELGNQNYSFFARLFKAMFRETKEVPAPPLSGAMREGLDGVIVPTIEKYGFLSPQISGLKFYSASIQYRLSIYDPDGVPIASWNVVGYGKSLAEGLRAKTALGDATMLAIRDGGARIALETGRQPAVKEWLEKRGLATE